MFLTVTVKAPDRRNAQVKALAYVRSIYGRGYDWRLSDAERAKV